MNFSQSNRMLQYVSLGAGFGIVLMLVWKLFWGGEAIVIPEFARPLTKADINWSVLRTPLKVTLPDFAVTLSAQPSPAFALSPVSLQANVEGQAQGQFVYSFDCQDDGVYELETAGLDQKAYNAQGLCIYQEGSFRAKVAVKSVLNYYLNQDQEITETKEKVAFVSVKVVSANRPPEISVCDIFPVEGTTQTNFLFTYLVDAVDPDGDELVYFWEFGDGVTSSQPAPSYTYKAPGLYLPKVTVFDNKNGKASCVASSLLVLNEFTPFQKDFQPKTKGRQNPFEPTSKNIPLTGSAAFATTSEATSGPGF